MDGYSVKDAANLLGVKERRVWELIARGVLASASDGPDVRVFLQPRPASPRVAPGSFTGGAPYEPEPARHNGNGDATHEMSPFRELLTEFRSLTERYGQALLALGEARGEVASLRTRVELLEARMDLRLPGTRPASTVAWELPGFDAGVRPAAGALPAAPGGQPTEAEDEISPDAEAVTAAADAAAADAALAEVQRAVEAAASESRTASMPEPTAADAASLEGSTPTDEVAPPDEVAPTAEVAAPEEVKSAEEPAAAEPSNARRRRAESRRQKIKGGRSALVGIAEALARAEDPTLAELPGAREAAEALAALQRDVESGHEAAGVAAEPAADSSLTDEAPTTDELPPEEPSATISISSVSVAAPEEDYAEVAPADIDEAADEAPTSEVLQVSFAAAEHIDVDESAPAPETVELAEIEDVPTTEAITDEPMATEAQEVTGEAEPLTTVEPIEPSEAVVPSQVVVTVETATDQEPDGAPIGEPTAAPAAAAEEAAHELVSAPGSPYSTDVVEPDWFADGDFTWLEAAQAEAAQAEAAQEEAAQEEAAPVDEPVAAAAPSDTAGVASVVGETAAEELAPEPFVEAVQQEEDEPLTVEPQPTPAGAEAERHDDQQQPAVDSFVPTAQDEQRAEDEAREAIQDAFDQPMETDRATEPAVAFGMPAEPVEVDAAIRPEPDGARHAEEAPADMQAAADEPVETGDDTADTPVDLRDEMAEEPVEEAIQDAFGEPMAGGQDQMPEDAEASSEQEAADVSSESAAELEVGEAIQDAFSDPEPVIQPPPVSIPPASEAPSASTSGEPPTRAQTGEEELMWLGDEFEEAGLEIATHGWRSADARPSASEPPLLELSDAELSQLAQDEGWDLAEVEAIRSLLGRTPPVESAPQGIAPSVAPIGAGTPIPVAPDVPVPTPTPGIAGEAPARRHSMSSMSDPQWLKGRRGPAATAYRRLRRLFPG